MKRGAWINLALFIAVVALGVFAYLKPKHEMPALKLSALTAADVNAFKIENAGITNVVVAHVNNAWQLTAPIKARADDFQVARVLNILNATSDTELSADHLDHFDLGSDASAPPTQLVIAGKHADQTFVFGMFNDLSHQQYVLTNNRVYLVGLQYGLALPKDAYQLVDKKLFADDEMPASLEFPQFKLQQQNGEWKLTPQAQNYSQDDFNRWVEDWTHASALAVLPRDAARNAKPALTIHITLRNNNVITLRVLQVKPAFLIARDDQPALIYQFSPDIAHHLLSAPIK